MKLHLVHGNVPKPINSRWPIYLNDIDHHDVGPRRGSATELLWKFKGSIELI